MSLEVEATYQDGMLKLDQPLPLAESERVFVTVRSKVSRIRRLSGMLRWTGDPETLRKIAEDPELDVLESP